MSAAPSPAERAQQFARLLIEGQFESAVGRFDPTMAQAMPQDKLSAFWAGLVGQAGPVRSVGEPSTEPVEGYTRVLLPVQFERAELVLKVSLDGEGRVAGLFVQPPAVEWQPPPYADPNALRERELSVGEGEHRLPGTLTVPTSGGKAPAVVLVHGSGPNDRDESVGARKAFRDLAWGVASQGVAVLRYDKRTRAHPLQMLALGPALTVEQEVLADAVAAAALLRAQPEVEGQCVFVLGHSLGATLAPRIGERDPKLAGLILAAGTARPLEDVVLAQFEYLDQLAGSPPQAQAQLDKIRAQVAEVKALKPGDPAPATLLLGLSAPYWLDLKAYDAPARARSLQMPMLLLQGGRDYQVTSEDFELWKTALSGRADVTSELYPDLDHHFGAGSGPGRPEDYARPAPVAQALVEDVASWIRERCPGSP